MICCREHSENELHNLYPNLVVNFSKWGMNPHISVNGLLTHLPTWNLLNPTRLQMTISKQYLRIGIKGIPRTDSFKFNFATPSKLTKLFALSEIRKIYDPLGFLSLIITKSKLFKRTLSSPLQYDDELSETLNSQYHNSLTLPRF